MKYIGFDPIKGAKGKEDIVIKNSASTFVLEVKGMKNQPKQRSIENTRTHLTQYRSKNGQNKSYKGVLVVGREVDIPISERSKNVFEKNLLELLVNEEICSITTEQLFQMAIDILNNKIIKEEVLSLIENTNGLLKGFQLN